MLKSQCSVTKTILMVFKMEWAAYPKRLNVCDGVFNTISGVLVVCEYYSTGKRERK